MRRFQQVAVGPRGILAIAGDADLWLGRHAVTLRRLALSLVRQQHSLNLLAILRPLKRADQRGQHGRVRQLAGIARICIRKVDMRGVFEVSVEGELGAIRRPDRVADACAVGNLDGHFAVLRVEEQVEARAAADPKTMRAAADRVEGHFAQVDPRLGHPLKRRHAVAAGNEELLPIRTQVGQRDILLPQGQKGVGNLLGRHQVGFLAQVIWLRQRKRPQGGPEEGNYRQQACEPAAPMPKRLHGVTSTSERSG